MSASAHPTRTIHIDLTHAAYEILIGSDVLSRVGAMSVASTGARRVFVISDENVAALYSEPVMRSLAEAELETSAITIPAGETSKSIKVAEGIWEEMCRKGADRQACVLALGGGVVGDLAGFVAATYARGLSFVQVPTTLLAQVDSSVGGKVGINLSRAKNMVGCFWQPRGVLIDIQALRTLPDREYRAGLAEVVKYGVILDEAFFAFLEDHVDQINRQEAETLIQVVSQCCQLKAQVVQKDEREENGLRAVLNYGHTYAHAFEALTGYGTILHGEAVAMGMACGARLAEKLGMIDAASVARQNALLDQLQIPIEPPHISRDDFVSAILRDKKAANGQARFILPRRIGQVDLVSGVDSDLAFGVIAG